jgi:hypothetical protein
MMPTLYRIKLCNAKNTLLEISDVTEYDANFDGLGGLRYKRRDDVKYCFARAGHDVTVLICPIEPDERGN